MSFLRERWLDNDGGTWATVGIAVGMEDTSGRAWRRRRNMPTSLSSGNLLRSLRADFDMPAPQGGDGIGRPKARWRLEATGISS